MDAIEWNKIFAAILVAGLTATLSGFVAEELVKPEPLAGPHIPLPAGAAPPTATTETAPAGPGAIGPLLAKADAAVGGKTAKVCLTCHTLAKGEPAKIGPNLWNIVNRPKASAPGFGYSTALSGKGGAWDYQALNEFLFAPKTFAPGTKMTFSGLPKDKERADVIAYLRTLADTPPAPPSP